MLDPDRHASTTSRERERLTRPRHRDLAVALLCRQHLGRDHFFVELLAQFQRLDIIKKFDDVFIGAIPESAQKSGGQKFPAALPAIEIDVEEVGGIELYFDPRAAIGNDAKTVKHLAVEVHR